MKTKILAISLFSLLLFINSKAQVKTISGIVSSDDELSKLAGVSVIIKGTGKGTTTDSQGKFLITANTGEVLVFSFLGFQQKEITVNKEEYLSVLLSFSDNTLNDVVVIGYGTQKKGDVTGAISSIFNQSVKRGSGNQCFSNASG